MGNPNEQFDRTHMAFCNAPDVAHDLTTPIKTYGPVVGILAVKRFDWTLAMQSQNEPMHPTAIGHSKMARTCRGG